MRRDSKSKFKIVSEAFYNYNLRGMTSFVTTHRRAYVFTKMVRIGDCADLSTSAESLSNFSILMSRCISRLSRIGA